MNRRIRKKKQKQWEQQQARIEQAIVNLLELVEEARRDYWRRWAEESTKQFVAEVMRHYEPRGRKEELKQSISRLATWYAPLLLGRHEAADRNLILQLNTAAPQKGRGAGNPLKSGGLTTAAVFKADRRFLCPFLGQPLFGRQKRRNLMAFFNSAVDVLQTLVIALGAGLGIWGVINLLEGYGNDNPGANAHVR